MSLADYKNVAIFPRCGTVVFYELKARVHTKILYVSIEKIAKFHAGEILLAGCRDDVRQAASIFIVVRTISYSGVLCLYVRLYLGEHRYLYN